MKKITLNLVENMEDLKELLQPYNLSYCKNIDFVLVGHYATLHMSLFFGYCHESGTHTYEKLSDGYKEYKELDELYSDFENYFEA